MPRRSTVERDIAQNRLVVSPIAHGSDATYTNYHCRCEPCRRAHREYTRIYRQEKIALWICVQCPEFRIDGHVRCQKHHDANLATYFARKAAHL